MNGCNKGKCPCRTWINCSQYTDIKSQQLRLKHKEYDKKIEEWYNINFKINYELPTSVPNG